MTETAKIYGSCLYDLAQEESLTEVLMQELTEVRSLFRENPDYEKLLGEPSVPKKERVRLIEEAFGEHIERYLVNFLKILSERGIISEFGGCCEEYIRRYRADHNIAEAVVYTAVPLSEQQRTALKERLEKMSGKEIIMTEKIRRSLIAGVRVELEGKQLDGSLQGRLAGISRKLEEAII